MQQRCHRGPPTGSLVATSAGLVVASEQVPQSRGPRHIVPSVSANASNLHRGRRHVAPQSQLSIPQPHGVSQSHAQPHVTRNPILQGEEPPPLHLHGRQAYENYRTSEQMAEQAITEAGLMDHVHKGESLIDAAARLHKVTMREEAARQSAERAAYDSPSPPLREILGATSSLSPPFALGGDASPPNRLSKRFFNLQSREMKQRHLQQERDERQLRRGVVAAAHDHHEAPYDTALTGDRYPEPPSCGHAETWHGRKQFKNEPTTQGMDTDTLQFVRAGKQIVGRQQVDSHAVFPTPVPERSYSPPPNGKR